MQSKTEEKEIEGRGRVLEDTLRRLNIAIIRVLQCKNVTQH